MDFKEAVNSKPVVLVEFFATWCPHCKRMMPVVEEVKELLEGSVDIYQLDIDLNEALAEKEGVNVVPTFIIYKNGDSQLPHTPFFITNQAYLFSLANKLLIMSK